MISRTQLGYSALGTCSVAIGLANSILTLRMLGVSGESDVWLLSLAIVATFAFLSQMGVDQFLIFFEHERALGEGRALIFARAACHIDNVMPASNATNTAPTAAHAPSLRPTIFLKRYKALRLYVRIVRQLCLLRNF